MSTGDPGTVVTAEMRRRQILGEDAPIAPGADTYDMLAPSLPLHGAFRGLQSALAATAAGQLGFNYEFWSAVKMAGNLPYDHGRAIFVGNGGSAAIASHMALDWTKAAHIPSLCFNDLASLTAWANDEGYDQVFARPIAAQCHKADLLFAISSSGESASILNAVEAAKIKGMRVITLSGFKPDNRLRALGHLNFYVPSDRYGLVEVAHHAILHAILDQIVEHGPRAG